MRAKELAAKVRTSWSRDTLCGGERERKMDTGREKTRKGSMENKSRESKEDVSGREEDGEHKEGVNGNKWQKGGGNSMG